MRYSAAAAALPFHEYASGVTQESKAIEKSYAKAVTRRLESVAGFALLSKLHEQFETLVGCCSVAGWDGYDANALSIDAAVRALKFIASLPPNLSNADISVNRFGDVEAEWYVRPNKLFTLSIGEGGRYFFSSLNGLEKRSGSGYLGGPMISLLFDIRRVLAD